MFARIGRWWRAVKEFYLFALPIRFSFLALVVLAFSWLISDQGGDILRALAEDKADGAVWRLIALLLLVNVLAYTIWYASRHMLRYRPHVNDVRPVDQYAKRPTPAEAPKATEWTPRWLGLSVFFIHLAGLAKVGWVYSKTNGGLPPRVWWATGWLVVTGALYFWLVRNRRRLLHMRQEELYVTYETAGQLLSAARGVLIATVILEVIIFAITFINPVNWYLLGVAAVVVLTITIWVPLGSALVALGEYLRFPILGGLLAWALLISPSSCVDNHRVRPFGESVAQRVPLAKALNDWHTRVAAMHPAGTRLPMIVVATEGGGIRAAYWTSAVLSSLQDQIPAFADHTFAISGVSGGSLGATVFDALLARRLEKAHAPTNAAAPIKSFLDTLHEPRTFAQETHDMLGFDALSGTLSAMAQPDLAQRFIPLPIFPDRAKALEEGWETGWRKAFKDDVGNDLFAGGFVAMLQRHPNLPVLMLNGTIVETGDRMITSNVTVRPDLNFRNAYDAFDELQTDIRLSTAANMSARFTYVGPAGTIPNHHNGATASFLGFFKHQRKDFGHVIDGGYFENSGAVTAAEVVNAARAQFTDIDPIVIVIDYFDSSRQKPDDVKPFCPAYGPCGPPSPNHSDNFANEILSPLRGLLNTRGARGTQAVGDIVQISNTGFVEFRLVPRRVPLPLGWVLSDAAKSEIDDAMGFEGGNRSGVAMLNDRLNGGTPKPGPCAIGPCESNAMQTKHEE